MSRNQQPPKERVMGFLGAILDITSGSSKCRSGAIGGARGSGRQRSQRREVSDLKSDSGQE